MAGCVVSQARTFHDNVSVHRFGILPTVAFTITSTIWLVSCCVCILFLFKLAAWVTAETALQWTLPGQSSATTSSLQSVCLSDFLLWYLREMLLLVSAYLGL